MSLLKANMRSGDKAVVIAGSAKGQWTTVNTDCRSASSTALLMAPSSITTTGFNWLEVPSGVTRVLVRCRYPKATASVGTSPIVYVFGAYKDGNSGVIASTGTCPTDGTVQTIRLDAATANAAGQTITLTVSTSTTNNDATYWYSNPIDLDGYDIKGADYIGIGVQTAAAITASAAVEAQVLLLN